MKVKDVMTRSVVTVGPQTRLKAVAALLVEHRISGLPVVNEEERVLGVVSESDILYKERDPEPSERSFLERLLRRGDPELGVKSGARTAGEAMTAPAIMIRPSASLYEAATLMLDRGVDRLVVVEDGNYSGEIEDGILVGIIARSDCVRAFARPDEEIAREISEIIERQFWIPAYQLQASVKQGEVTLEGEVDLRGTAESLEYAAARIPGVVSVRSDVTWRMEEERAPTLSRDETALWR